MKNRSEETRVKERTKECRGVRITQEKEGQNKEEKWRRGEMEKDGRKLGGRESEAG